MGSCFEWLSSGYRMVIEWLWVVMSIYEWFRVVMSGYEW